MTDFTIIIPHRGSALGLWATIHSCEEDLLRSKKTYNYVIVTNGGEFDVDTRNTLQQLEATGRLLKHLHFDEPLSPPVARQRGSAAADGELLFFFDNHCLVGRQYFDRAVLDFESEDIGLLHSTTMFHSGQGTHYQYELTLPFNFWAQSALQPYEGRHKPYRIAAGGHGAFVVRRSVWEACGGYGPESLFVGYAGEELACDLKLWRLGKEVWLDPNLSHYHYAGARGYPRHYYDDYYINLLVSAHVAGGEEWLYKLFDSFVTKCHLRLGAALPMYDLLQIAHNRSAEYARLVDASSVRTLNETLAYFKANQIPQ
jgi:hypothetical protein